MKNFLTCALILSSLFFAESARNKAQLQAKQATQQAATQAVVARGSREEALVDLAASPEHQALAEQRARRSGLNPVYYDSRTGGASAASSPASSQPYAGGGSAAAASPYVGRSLTAAGGGMPPPPPPLGAAAAGGPPAGDRSDLFAKIRGGDVSLKKASPNEKKKFKEGTGGIGDAARAAAAVVSRKNAVSKEDLDKFFANMSEQQQEKVTDIVINGNSPEDVYRVFNRISPDQWGNITPENFAQYASDTLRNTGQRAGASGGDDKKVKDSSDAAQKKQAQGSFKELFSKYPANGILHLDRAKPILWTRGYNTLVDENLKNRLGRYFVEEPFVGFINSIMQSPAGCRAIFMEYFAPIENLRKKLSEDQQSLEQIEGQIKSFNNLPLVLQKNKKNIGNKKDLLRRRQKLMQRLSRVPTGRKKKDAGLEKTIITLGSFSSYDRELGRKAYRQKGDAIKQTQDDYLRQNREFLPLTAYEATRSFKEWKDFRVDPTKPETMILYWKLVINAMADCIVKNGSQIANATAPETPRPKVVSKKKPKAVKTIKVYPVPRVGDGPQNYKVEHESIPKSVQFKRKFMTQLQIDDHNEKYPNLKIEIIPAQPRGGGAAPAAAGGGAPLGGGDFLAAKSKLRKVKTNDKSGFIKLGAVPDTFDNSGNIYIQFSKGKKIFYMNARDVQITDSKPQSGKFLSLNSQKFKKLKSNAVLKALIEAFQKETDSDGDNNSDWDD